MNTWWHITFGTYAARLHGDKRPTVDRAHNLYGRPFLPHDPKLITYRRERMTTRNTVYLSKDQRTHIESRLGALCVERDWLMQTCAAAPDHIHILARIPEEMHGKRARALLKRRLTQELDQHWCRRKRPDGSSWWGEGGSTKVVKGEAYFNNVVRYIGNQRTIQPE